MMSDSFCKGDIMRNRAVLSMLIVLWQTIPGFALDSVLVESAAKQCRLLERDVQGLIGVLRGNLRAELTPLYRLADVTGQLAVGLENRESQEKIQSSFTQIRSLMDITRQSMDLLENRVSRSEAQSIRGHWDNVAYREGRLKWLLSLRRSRGPELGTGSIGPVTAEQREAILQGCDSLVARRDDLARVLEETPGEVMYRKLFLTQLDGLDEPISIVRKSLQDPQPWWTPETYKAVSDCLRIHGITRNERVDFDQTLARADREFTQTLKALLAALDPVERGCRRRGIQARVVFLQRPGADI